MAWWDHEELKSLADRSTRYVLAFPEEYDDDFVRSTALEVLQNPKSYPYLQESAKRLLSYGLEKGQKPKFRVKCISKKI
jgi:hypothetical protein